MLASTGTIATKERSDQRRGHDCCNRHLTLRIAAMVGAIGACHVTLNYRLLHLCVSMQQVSPKGMFELL